jgi:hypothetical protein
MLDDGIIIKNKNINKGELAYSTKLWSEYASLKRQYLSIYIKEVRDLALKISL